MPEGFVAQRCGYDGRSRGLAWPSFGGIGVCR
jgi:hypothetical protein